MKLFNKKYCDCCGKLIGYYVLENNKSILNTEYFFCNKLECKNF